MSVHVAKLMEELADSLAQLLKLAGEMNDKLDSGTVDEQTMKIMSERETMVNQVRQLNSAIDKAIDSPGDFVPGEEERSVQLAEKIDSLSERINEVSAEGEKKIRSLMGSITAELGGFSQGRRSVAGYGGMQKRIYAKYIDRKS